MSGPFRGHGKSIQLPGQTHGKIADVDHLLHLTQSFLVDLAAFQRDQGTQRLLVPAQLAGEQPYQLAPLRGRYRAPCGKRPLRLPNLFLHLRR